MPKSATTLAKNLATQRKEAFDRLPQHEAAQHAIFQACQYPRVAWQHDFKTNTPEQVMLISYGFDPTADAVIPTCVCRGKEGRAFRCSIDMVHLTEEEVWDLITEDLQEAIRDRQRELVEHTQNLVNLQLQLDNAVKRGKA